MKGEGKRGGEGEREEEGEKGGGGEEGRKEKGEVRRKGGGEGGEGGRGGEGEGEIEEGEGMKYREKRTPQVSAYKLVITVSTTTAIITHKHLVS